MPARRRTPSADNNELFGGQQALLAFQPGGLLEADFAAAPGSSAPANHLTSGQGEWVVRDGLWHFALAAFMRDAEQRFAATVVFDGEGQPFGDGTGLEGTFSFEVAAADGQVIGQGAGTWRGQPLPLEP